MFIEASMEGDERENDILMHTESVLEDLGMEVIPTIDRCVTY